MLVHTTRAALMHRSASSLARSVRQQCAESIASTSTLHRAALSPCTPAAVRTAVSAWRPFTHATRPALNDGSKQALSAPPSEEPVEPAEPRLSLTFTCTVAECGHRSTHEFAKRSYERGIVLVQCPNCKNRHLIADHLSWFTETSDEPKTIEQIVAAKGGRVRRGVQTSDGKGYETVEILSDSDDDASDSSSAQTSSTASDAQPK